MSTADQKGPLDDIDMVSTQAAFVLEEAPFVEQISSKQEMSQAIPFMERPSVLNGDLAGDFGFDPLKLAKNKEALWSYREAEVKHARLAMLAAAGWPLSELWDRNIAEYFGIETTLDDADRVPFFFNVEGLQKISPEFWGFCLGLTAAIDTYGFRRARSEIPGYIPGDLGWDPLGLYPVDLESRKRMQLQEILHGRTAMLAVTGYASQEAISNVGVVDETPLFFFPITETAEQVLQDVADTL